MKVKDKNSGIVYRPILFLAGTFIITWCCMVQMTKIDYHAHAALFTFVDFMENASPLVCALLLLGPYLNKDRFIWRFLLGEPSGVYSYIAVFLLFAAQFLNFYLFQIENAEFSVQVFASTFVGQLLLGGGLEEAGWRGYLFPCFYQKYHAILASVGVSMIWVLWHLPVFFIPDTMQANESFLSYSIIGIITGFILTAIYLLTKSVLLCTLFHSWQNTIVMTVQADMGNPWFMIGFILLGMVSVLLCLYMQRREKLADRARRSE